MVQGMPCLRVEPRLRPPKPRASSQIVKIQYNTPCQEPDLQAVLNLRRGASQACSPIAPELSPPKHAHTTIRRGLQGGDRESPERYAIRLPNDISHFERNIVAFIFLTLLAWTSLIQGLRGQVQYAVDTQRVYEGDGWLGTSKCIYERNGRELISLYLQAALLLQ